VFFTLLIVAACAWALWESRNFGYRAGLFPWAIGFPALAMAIAQLGLDLTGRGGGRSLESLADGSRELPRSIVVRRSAVMCAWIVGLFVAIWLFGFIIAIPLTTFVYLMVARERWWMSLGLAAASWGFVYGLFERFLLVPFPQGQLFEWFGWGL
jgi:hypothetical protein